MKIPPKRSALAPGTSVDASADASSTALVPEDPARIGFICLAPSFSTSIRWLGRSVRFIDRSALAVLMGAFLLVAPMVASARTAVAVLPAGHASAPVVPQATAAQRADLQALEAERIELRSVEGMLEQGEQELESIRRRPGITKEQRLVEERRLNRARIPLLRLQKQHGQQLQVLEGRLAPILANAEQALVSAGFPEDLASRMTPEGAVLLAQVVKRLRGPLYRKEAREIFSLFLIDPVRKLQALMTQMDRLLSHYDADARDFKLLLRPVDDRTLGYAHFLHTRYGVPISPRHFDFLSKLAPEDFANLQVLLQRLSESAPVSIRTEAYDYPDGAMMELERLGMLLPLVEGKSIEIGVRRASGSPPSSALRMKIDLAGLQRGFEELHDRYGLAPSAKHLEAAVMLGAGDAYRRAALHSLFRRTSLTGHPRETRLLVDQAEALGGLSEKGTKVDDAYRIVDDVALRLGRTIEANEVVAVIRASAHGAKLDEIVPEKGLRRALRRDGGRVLLKDLYVWDVLPDDVVELSRSDLVKAIEGLLVPGTSRDDYFAEYQDDFASQHHLLTMGELHEIRLLLLSRDTQDTMIAQELSLRSDLKATDTEVGGVTVLVGNQVQLEVLPAASRGDNHAYIRPFLPIRRLHVFTYFHQHAVNASEPFAVGPSSTHRGTGHDRGLAWESNQDELVITPVSPTMVNWQYCSTSGVVVNFGDKPRWVGPLPRKGASP